MAELASVQGSASEIGSSDNILIRDGRLQCRRRDVKGAVNVSWCNDQECGGVGCSHGLGEITGYRWPRIERAPGCELVNSRCWRRDTKGDFRLRLPCSPLSGGGRQCTKFSGFQLGMERLSNSRALMTGFDCSSAYCKSSWNQEVVSSASFGSRHFTRSSYSLVFIQAVVSLKDFCLECCNFIGRRLKFL